MTNQRKITPHKGRRDSNLSLRLTPDEKARLRAMAKQLNMSIADYIMQCVDASQPAPDESEDAR
jgi:uncharacterized protein (DUF1778 family)